jgi:hypothetical protein
MKGAPEEISEGRNYDELVQNPANISSALKMSPRELADFFQYLTDNDLVESFFSSARHDLATHFYVPLFSYFEKWIASECTRRKLDDISRAHLTNSPAGELPLSMDQRFNEKEIRLILNQLVAMQLSFGCSGACPKCMFDAVPVARDFFDYSKVRTLIAKFADIFSFNKPIFYWASDNRDFPGYPSLHEFIRKRCGYDPHVTTKVSDDPESLEWLKELSAVARNVRISLYHMFDVAKMKALRTKIEEATNGVFGKEDTDIFSVASEYDARLELLETLKDSLSGYDFGVSCPAEEKPQGHISGIGTTFEKPTSNKCDMSNGTIITPRGVYNVLRTLSTSETFPQEHMVVPIIAILEIKPKVGDYLPDILPFCVVEEETYEYPKEDHEALYDDYVIPNNCRYGRLEATLIGDFFSFKISYSNEGYITGVERLP